jgi:hypothetical protein
MISTHKNKQQDNPNTNLAFLHSLLCQSQQLMKMPFRVSTLLKFLAIQKARD